MRMHLSFVNVYDRVVWPSSLPQAHTGSRRDMASHVVEQVTVPAHVRTASSVMQRAVDNHLRHRVYAHAYNACI
jgi:hypothetical protein